MGKTFVVKLLAGIPGSPTADDISKWTNGAVKETEAPRRHFDSSLLPLGLQLSTQNIFDVLVCASNTSILLKNGLIDESRYYRNTVTSYINNTRA